MQAYLDFSHIIEESSVPTLTRFSSLCQIPLIQYHPVMSVVLLLLCAGVFISLFPSTQDGFLWLIAGALVMGIVFLDFPLSP